MNGSESKVERICRWLLQYIDENKFSENPRVIIKDTMCAEALILPLIQAGHRDLQRENIYCSIQQGQELGVQVASRLMQMIQRKECDDKGYSLVLRPQIYPGDSIRNV